MGAGRWLSPLTVFYLAKVKPIVPVPTRFSEDNLLLAMGVN
jgi:hypothetical protein